MPKSGFESTCSIMISKCSNKQNALISDLDALKLKAGHKIISKYTCSIPV
jgi:hypothetical protein